MDDLSVSDNHVYKKMEGLLNRQYRQLKKIGEQFDIEDTIEDKILEMLEHGKRYRPSNCSGNILALAI